MRDFSISVLVPSLNHLEYVDLLYKSLVKNSHFDHEFLVFFNHAKPEEKKWAQDNSVKFLFSNKNEGISMPYNQLAKLSTKKFILLADDDMYFLPEWDVALRRSFEKEERGMWRTLTVVEPIVDSIWNFNVVMNFGRTAGTFKEAELLSWIEKSPPKKPLMICHRPPNLVRREDYLEVGGWSLEFGV